MHFSATIAFYIIPETENRSLEDIEMHFSDKKRKFFDRKIQMNAAEMNAAEMNATISSNHTEPGKVWTEPTKLNEFYLPLTVQSWIQFSKS